MERHCKNCNELIYAGKSHCSNCGCKWIENRITMKQVVHDFGDMYIGIDTKFVRTFIDLFKKPEAVILGYMNGRRVNYMDAVRYLLISIFITGVFMFIIKQLDLDLMKVMDLDSMYQSLGYSQERIAKELEMQRSIQEFQSKYLSIIIFASIPFIAFIGKLTFWGKKYFNFTEQIVFYMYTYSHITIATTIISILLVLILPNSFLYWSSISYVIMLIYIAYCYKRCFKLTWQEIILKTLLAIIIFIVAVFLILIIGTLFGFLAALIADYLGYDVKGYFKSRFV